MRHHHIRVPAAVAALVLITGCSADGESSGAGPTPSGAASGDHGTGTGSLPGSHASRCRTCRVGGSPTRRPGEDDSTALYLMKPDGTDRRCLVDTEGPDSWPAWSPDGRLLAFVGGAGSVDQVFIIRADGTGLRQVTDSSSITKESLDWSPDGLQIAYSASASVDSGPFSIHLVDLDGSHDETIAETRPPDVAFVELGGLVARREDHPLRRDAGAGSGLWTMTPEGRDKPLSATDPGTSAEARSTRPTAPASSSKPTSTVAASIEAMPARDTWCASPKVARRVSSWTGHPTAGGSSGPEDLTGLPTPR